jgi:glycosyltransferase involved in cell wall biosynthesis
VKIALVTDTFAPQVNGVTTVLIRMATAIREAGHDVIVVAPRYPGQEESRANGQLRLASVPFPPYPAIRLTIPPYGDAYRYLSSFAPDVVHVATEGPLGGVGRRYALRTKTPLVTSFHTDFPRYCRDYGLPSLESWVWRWLVWFHRPARLTHTPGEAILAKLQGRGLSQAVLWGRGVDTALFSPQRRMPEWRQRLGLAEEAVIVVHVGRLAREKNLGVLANAWSLARKQLGGAAEFLLVGDGPIAAELEAKLPWVRRMGFMARNELANVYANSDICLLPSDTETCGLVALEAMASGLPVVAADAGGFRDSVRAEHNGLLVPPDRPETFADAVVRLALDSDYRRALASRARQTAEERDVEAENALLIDHYRQTTTN